MADAKISALTALTGANLATADLFAVVDLSAATTKKITADELRQAAVFTDYFLQKTAGGAAVTNLGAVSSNTNVVAATGSTEALDVSVYASHDTTMDQNCTFTFTNWPASGKLGMFVWVLRGSFTPTLPTVVNADGSASTYTTPAVYAIWSFNGGTTVFLKQIGKAFA